MNATMDSTPHIPDAYRCPDPSCRGKIVKGLYLDCPQEEAGHEYQWVCRGKCHRTYGESWVTRLWGKSDPTPALPYEPWEDEMPLPITRQMLRRRPTASGARP